MIKTVTIQRLLTKGKRGLRDQFLKEIEHFTFPTEILL